MTNGQKKKLTIEFAKFQPDGQSELKSKTKKRENLIENVRKNWKKQILTFHQVLKWFPFSARNCLENEI